MTSTIRSISRREVLLGMSALPYAIAAAGETPSARTAGLDVRPLRARFKGDLIVPGDPRYQSARLTNNRAFDHYPGLIARCLDADDVARTLEFARTNALPLAIRSGGHCQAGRSSCDAGGGGFGYLTTAAWARVHPYTQAAYVNMLGDESEERVREAYGDNYSRAARLKTKYDPENVFRLNQNIKPA